MASLPINDAGIRGQNLYKLYCCYIRSCIEYLSPVYHSMLHKGQEETLEKLHRFALRVCFGTKRKIRDVMEERAIEPLHVRRQRRVDSFVAKAVVANPRFSHWFPRSPGTAMDLNRRREFAEVRSRTTRRLRLKYLKRRANELGL